MMDRIRRLMCMVGLHYLEPIDVDPRKPGNVLFRCDQSDRCKGRLFSMETIDMEAPL